MKTFEELKVEGAEISDLLKKDIEHFKYFVNLCDKKLTPEEAIAIAMCFKPPQEDLDEMKLRFVSCRSNTNANILNRDLRIDLTVLDSSVRFYDYIKELMCYTECNFKETVEKVNEMSDSDGKTYKSMHLRKTLYLFQICPYDTEWHRENVERCGEYLLDMDIMETAKRRFEDSVNQFNFDEKWKRTEWVDCIVRALEDRMKAICSVMEFNEHLDKYKC